MKKITSVFLALVLIIISVPAVFAANPVPATPEWLSDWENRSSLSGKIWQNPGDNENDRVFTWLSDNTDNSFTYSDGRNKFTVTPDTKITVYGVVNTVELSDLRDGRYKYSYTADGKEFSGKTFSVDTKTEGFTAMFCSDPQLGRSGDDSIEAVQNDTYGWERTLISAQNNGAELILCAGDQVNDGFSALQYNALFSPDTLSSLPFAPTAGNHDFYSPLYSTYFGNAGTAGIGNDYYFSYGNALFIVLDSNDITSLSHEKTISDAVNTYPDAPWRVVMLHHGAYSAGAEEFTNKICTLKLRELFDIYDIDLALSGHNHFYSRTYPVYNGQISTVGTVYFEAGSASGSKCGSYDDVSAEYIVHHEDLKAASYSLLTFTDDTIEITSYLTDSGEIFDSFTVVNSDEEGGIPQMGLLELIIRWIKSILARIPVPYLIGE
ncbi:MAG: metallophosphoesterase [Clostridia bacterium]|nr:metallophosphoesterase [Clostridia bacterium]